MKFVMILILLVSVSSAFSAGNTKAEWVTEAGILLLPGQAAVDLYQSLKSKEIRNRLSTKYHELRTKKNKFAECEAVFERGDTWDEFVLTSAQCRIKAPVGTVIKY